jgi:hypothetical protein
MPTAVVANSMGTPQPDNGSEPLVQKPGQKGQKPGVPAGKSGGEINLSRAEAAALLVFETEDEKGSMKRAQEWSACSRCRLCLLRRLSATPPARRRQRWTSISKSWSGGGRTIFGFRSAATFAGGVRWRASDSHLVWCRDDQTTIPALDVLDLKERCDSLEQRRPPGLRKPNQQKAVMRARCVLPNVREVQVLRDEEAMSCLSGLPHDGVVFSGDALSWHGVNIVPEIGQN